jgi:hypothetical protein
MVIYRFFSRLGSAALQVDACGCGNNAWRFA